MTVEGDGTFVDRRRVEIVEKGLPCMPHHHDALKLPVGEGVALVERVTRSAEKCAVARLDELAGSVPVKISGIALRVCPPLPPTIAERLASYRAQNTADWVMYRQALARAAEARGWFVHWYDARRVIADAAKALGKKSLDPLFDAMKKELGPPWQIDHKQATAAAIAAASS